LRCGACLWYERDVTIAIGVPTLLAHPAAVECIQSWAPDRTGADLLVLFNGSPGDSAILRATSLYQYQPGTLIIHLPANVGVAAAWNQLSQKAWEKGHDVVALVNDDAQLVDPSVLERARLALNDCPRQLIAVNGLGFSCFFLTRQVWDEVGPFDAGFFPAYYEDKDYEYRLKLAGIPVNDLQGDVVHRGGGSQTIAGNFAMHAQVDWSGPLNRARYIRKWGGPPGEETVQMPWGGAPSAPTHPPRADGGVAITPEGDTANTFPPPLYLVPAGDRVVLEFGAPERRLVVDAQALLRAVKLAAHRSI
jgi:GT2 family glycosyltransferase